jgi:hypothetical protein
MPVAPVKIPIFPGLLACLTLAMHGSLNSYVRQQAKHRTATTTYRQMSFRTSPRFLCRLTALIILL